MPEQTYVLYCFIFASKLHTLYYLDIVSCVYFYIIHSESNIYSLYNLLCKPFIHLSTESVNYIL